MRSDAKLIILIFYVLLFGISLFLIAYIPQAFIEEQTKIYFFDVNQGDSSLIVTPDLNYILVDGGPDNNVIYKLGKYLPFFERKIDLIVLTHPHDDHLVGLLEVMKRYDVKMILMPKTQCQTAACQQLEKIIEQKRILVQFADHRGVMNVGLGVEFEILMPEKFDPLEKNLNNHSIVFRLIADKASLIFTGDQENEEDLIGENLKSDVIKIGHHGSHNANNCDFLRTVDPTYAVISVGKENKFNHPSQSTLECLTILGSEIIRTDESGDIKFLIEKGDLAKVR